MWLLTNILPFSNVRDNLGDGIWTLKYWHFWNIFMTYSISGAASLKQSMTLLDHICEQLLIPSGERRACVGGRGRQYKGFHANDCALVELDVLSKPGCISLFWITWILDRGDLHGLFSPFCSQLIITPPILSGPLQIPLTFSRKFFLPSPFPVRNYLFSSEFPQYKPRVTWVVCNQCRYLYSNY